MASTTKNKDREGKAAAPRGVELLHDPMLNKGTAFTEEERDQLGLRGLLPPRVFNQDEQVQRVMINYRNKPDDLEKYIYLLALQDRNEALFYRVVLDYIEEMMPIIYTPTVGRACQEFGHIWRMARGMFISYKHRGHVKEVLRNWPVQDVRAIVVTDGERILGLGDQGAQGMGIPVGKLSLYTACAGVHPKLTLPITLDVGTNNEALRKDPLYIGVDHDRLTGDEYYDFVDEFVWAVQDVFPKALLQFEDFANKNAFPLLDRYRDRICTFNDDIQGTAGVTLAALYSGARLTNSKLKDQKILFLGAGAAGVGIGDLIVSAMVADGLPEPEARLRCWYFDSTELVVAERDDLASHKKRFAHDHPRVHSFLDAVNTLKPTAIVGVSGQPRAFTKEIVDAMASFNAQPIIFALSNPTSKAEVTAADVYNWTDGRAVYASGSPFDPVTYKGRTFVPGQANNAYVFPGVALGVIAAGSKRVTDEMFFTAAKMLSKLPSQERLDQGCIFPPLSEIRKVSLEIAVAVADMVYQQGLTDEKRPDDLEKFIKDQMYQPTYPVLA